MPTKFVNILKTSKLRIRGQYLHSVSYVLLHFLTLRLYENRAPGPAVHHYGTKNVRVLPLDDIRQTREEPTVSIKKVPSLKLPLPVSLMCLVHVCQL